MYFPNSAAVSLLWCLNPNLCTLAGQYSLVLVCSHSCRTAALHVQWGGGNYQLGLLSNTCNNKRGRGRLAHRDSFSFYWNPILEFTAVSPGVGVFMWRQRGDWGNDAAGLHLSEILFFFCHLIIQTQLQTNVFMKLHLFPFTSNKAADAVAEAGHTSTYHCISPIEKLRLLVTQHACWSAVKKIPKCQRRKIWQKKKTATTVCQKTQTVLTKNNRCHEMKGPAHQGEWQVDGKSELKTAAGERTFVLQSRSQSDSSVVYCRNSVNPKLNVPLSRCRCSRVTCHLVRWGVCVCTARTSQ